MDFNAVPTDLSALFYYSNVSFIFKEFKDEDNNKKETVSKEGKWKRWISYLRCTWHTNYLIEISFLMEKLLWGGN